MTARLLRVIEKKKRYLIDRVGERKKDRERK